MKKPNCVLIPVDFSEPSMEAMEFGAMMAGQMGAAIVVLTVVEEFVQLDAYTIACPTADETRERLEKLFKGRVGSLLRPDYLSNENKLKILRVPGPSSIKSSRPPVSSMPTCSSWAPMEGAALPERFWAA